MKRITSLLSRLLRNRAGRHAYLESASDLAELERRMRRLERGDAFGNLVAR